MMKRLFAFLMTHILLLIHGFFWRVCFFRSFRTAAETAFDLKAIRYSSKFIDRASMKDIIDVVIHEVAHVIAGVTHGHDKTWINICQGLGGSGDIYCRSFIIKTDFPYVGYCQQCNKKKLLLRRLHIHCQQCGHYIRHYPNPRLSQ
jgi:predicted SprT family Zn-dependent metalloprotease